MSEQEELTETQLAIAGLNNIVNVISGISSNVRNIRYNSQNNTTTYYGHTNFEELKVDNKIVALAENIPDISTKANISHNHKTNEISRDFTSTIVNEEEEEEEITETISLNDILTRHEEREQFSLINSGFKTNSP